MLRYENYNLGSLTQPSLGLKTLFHRLEFHWITFGALILGHLVSNVSRIHPHERTKFFRTFSEAIWVQERWCLMYRKIPRYRVWITQVKWRRTTRTYRTSINVGGNTVVLKPFNHFTTENDPLSLSSDIDKNHKIE